MHVFWSTIQRIVNWISQWIKQEMGWERTQKCFYSWESWFTNAIYLAWFNIAISLNHQNTQTHNTHFNAYNVIHPHVVYCTRSQKTKNHQCDSKLPWVINEFKIAAHYIPCMLCIGRKFFKWFISISYSSCLFISCTFLVVLELCWEFKSGGFCGSKCLHFVFGKKRKKFSWLSESSSHQLGQMQFSTELDT